MTSLNLLKRGTVMKTKKGKEKLDFIQIHTRTGLRLDKIDELEKSLKRNFYKIRLFQREIRVFTKYAERDLEELSELIKGNLEDVEAIARDKD
jgi:hypothetical protein